MVTKMITTITEAIGGTLSGIGGAIVDFFDKAVLTTDGEMTTVAVWALAFLGISFGLGVVKFITSLVRH